MGLRLGALAAQDRHLGAGERGHAGIVELGVARRHQPPQVETAGLGCAASSRLRTASRSLSGLLVSSRARAKSILMIAEAGQQLDGAAIGGDGLGGAAVLVQHLAAQLVEIGIVGIFLQQAVDGEQRRAQRALAIERDGAGVARRHRAVGLAEALQGDVGRDEAHQLGDHAVMHVEELRRVGRVGVGRARRRLLERRDAVRRQRMGREVGVAPADLHALLLLQDAQELDRALGRLAGALEEGDGRLVGRTSPGSACNAGRTAASPARWRAAGRAASAAMPPPDAAPPAMAPAAEDRLSRICIVVRLRSSSCLRARWPPAIWPVSCASTPISWLGVSVRMIRPVLMKIRWPPATKALSVLSWTIMISTRWDRGRPPSRSA